MKPLLVCALALIVTQAAQAYNQVDPLGGTSHPALTPRQAEGLARALIEVNSKVRERTGIDLGLVSEASSRSEPVAHPGPERLAMREHVVSYLDAELERRAVANGQSEIFDPIAAAYPLETPEERDDLSNGIIDFLMELGPVEVLCKLFDNEGLDLFYILPQGEDDTDIYIGIKFVLNF